MHEIIHGDALQVLPKLDDRIYFDAVITDPPYCSGAATLSTKQQPSSKKNIPVRKQNAHIQILMEMQKISDHGQTGWSNG